MADHPILIFQYKGDWGKTKSFLKHILRRKTEAILQKYGKLGVGHLVEATPKDTGLTAASWDYHIERKGDDFRLVWTNSNVNRGIPIAILIQYGHGTTGGTYVEGRDYINPALRPIFDQIAEELWKEVTDG